MPRWDFETPIIKVFNKCSAVSPYFISNNFQLEAFKNPNLSFALTEHLT